MSERVPGAVETLFGTDPVLALRARRRLVALGPEALPLVLPRTGSVSFEASHRNSRLGSVFEPFGETALAYLADTLECEDFHIRTAALNALDPFRYDLMSTSCSRIGQQMSSTNIDLRSSAMEAIGILGAYHHTGLMTELAHASDEYAFNKLAMVVLTSLTRVCARSKQGVDDVAFRFFNRYFGTFRSQPRPRWSDETVRITLDQGRPFQLKSARLIASHWLTSSDSMLSSFACDLLGDLRADHATEGLITVFNDGNRSDDTRADAIVALARIGNRAGLDAVAGAAEGPTDGSFFYAVLHAYSIACWNPCVPLINRAIALADEDSRYRSLVRYSLAVRREQRLDVASDLRAGNKYHRCMAAHAVARSRNPQGPALLQRALADAEDGLERANILGALVNMECAEYGAELHSALCDWPDGDLEVPTKSNIAREWRRELLWAVIRADLGPDYESAWSRELKVDLVDAESEYASIFGLPIRRDDAGQSTTLARTARDSSVFVSYSRNDRAWVDLLLQELDRQDVRHNVWIDDDIQPGALWDQTIVEELNRTTHAVLLVTPHYFLSEYVQGRELPAIMHRVSRNRLKVTWVACETTDHAGTSLGRWQALNNPQAPLSTLTDARRDEEVGRVVQRLKGWLKPEIGRTLA
jgi:hypothetical protein